MSLAKEQKYVLDHFLSDEIFKKKKFKKIDQREEEEVLMLI